MKGFKALILAGVLLVLPFQATAQFPGFEQALTGDATTGLAAGDQVSVSVSEGDGTQLVVWADQRSNPYFYNEYETSSDIYAMRLDSNGNMLDAVPFTITSSPGSQTHPIVSWNGIHWLVVFQTSSLSGTGYYYETALAAIRVAPDGRLVDEAPIPIYGLTPGSTSDWVVASDGDQWVIAAQGTRVNNDIVAIRISSAGVVLDPPTNTLVEATYYQRTGLHLAHAGGGFMLTFNERTGTAAAKFDSSLNLLEPVGLILEGHSITDLASNGSEFFMTWSEVMPDYSQAVMGGRVNATGTLLDPSGINVSGAFSPDASGGGINVTWDGVNWRVSWPNSGGTRVAQVTQSGSVPTLGGTLFTDVTAGLTAGTGAQGLHLVWPEFANNEYDVFAATVDTNDTVQANAGISLATPMQYRTDIAAGEGGYLVVFRSELATQTRILAHPLNALGQPSLQEPIELDLSTSFNGLGSPAVAWNGSVYLVSWTTPAGVMAVRMQQDGTLLDTTPVTVMSSVFGPVKVAAAGGNFLVAGFRFNTTQHFVIPVAARISGSGSVLDSSPIALGGYYARSLSLTEFDGRWLAVWHRSVSHDDPMTETRGAFINTDGTLGKQFQAHGYFSISGGNSVFTTGLAAGGGKALMVQSQELTSGVETDLLAHLIGTDGTVEPMINLTPWQGNQYRPDVSFNGSDFIVVYQDQKNRSAPYSLAQLDARSDIYGIRIKPDGTILDEQGFLVSASPTGETDPAVASTGTESLILASLMTNDMTHAAYRVQVSEVQTSLNRFPVAIASASITSGDIPLDVEFSATGSNDPEGSTLTYLWQFTDGGSSSLANPIHRFSAPGVYPVVLTVFDELGQPSSQGVTITASAPNQLPVAVASASRLNGPLPFSTQLFADGSYDPDGLLGNIEWSSSDGRTYFGSPAYFTFNTEGTYTVTLRVYDNRGDFSEDTLTIVAGGSNQPPVAQISATPVSGLAPLRVEFSSAGSSDSDGSIASYDWDFGDGSSGSGANPSHLYTTQGSFTATLTVTDNSGASASKSIGINVTGSSGSALLTSIDMSAPKKRKRGTATVNAIVTVTNGNGGTEASAIVQGRWTLPDGSVAARYEYSDSRGQANFSTVATGDGVYSFDILTVTKSGFAWNSGDSETSDSLTIGDGATNQPPTASFTYSCIDLGCTFDGSASVDSDGSIAAYSWSFGDGSSAGGSVSDHVFGAPGTYTVTLTATDNQGLTGQSSQSVNVTDGSTPLVKVHVGDLDGTALTAPRNRWEAMVVVRVHDANELSVANATVSGQWSAGSKGAGSCVTDANGACSISKGNLKGNVGSVTFTVTDVSLAGGVYQPSSNHDGEADSDGTVIVVTQ